MKGVIAAALAVIWATGSARAQDYSADDLARRTIERRAIEVVNWGIPGVNTTDECLQLSAAKRTQLLLGGAATNNPPTQTSSAYFVVVLGTDRA